MRIIKFLIIWVMILFVDQTVGKINNENTFFNEKIQSIVDKTRLQYNLPALSVSIKLPGEENPRNFVSGYFSLSSKDKITPATMFQIGSITKKTVTASIIYQLAEQNKLNVDDKIG